MQPTPELTAETVEVAIPMPSARLQELAEACELMGTPIQKYLTDAVNGAIEAHLARYKTLKARLDAARAESQNLGVRIVDPATGSALEVERQEGGAVRLARVPAQGGPKR
jgi:hypothetical protein